MLNVQYKKYSHEVFRVFLALLSGDPPQRKIGHEKKNYYTL